MTKEQKKRGPSAMGYIADIARVIDPIWERTGITKKDIRKVLYAAWEIQCKDWLEKREIVCPPFGKLYIKEIHKDYTVDYKSADKTRDYTKPHTFKKLKTKKGMVGADKYAESQIGKYDSMFD